MDELQALGLLAINRQDIGPMGQTLERELFVISGDQPLLDSLTLHVEDRISRRGKSLHLDRMLQQLDRCSIGLDLFVGYQFRQVALEEDGDHRHVVILRSFQQGYRRLLVTETGNKLILELPLIITLIIIGGYLVLQREGDRKIIFAIIIETQSQTSGLLCFVIRIASFPMERLLLIDR